MVLRFMQVVNDVLIIETMDESLDQLVFRLKLWYQYAQQDRATQTPFPEVSCLESEGSVRESRLQRALQKLQNEPAFQPEATAMPESEPQDGYESPYPFATRRDYYLALRRQGRDAYQEIRRSLVKRELPDLYS